MIAPDTTQTIPALAVGDQAKLALSNTRAWWTVRAGDDRFTILTVQAPFKRRGVLQYTIIDRARGVRGPCNLIGQGWGDLVSDKSCVELLDALQAHDTNKVARDAWFAAHSDRTSVSDIDLPLPLAVEVSYRNNVLVEILAHRPVVTPPNERTPERSDFECHTDQDGKYFPFFETEDGDRYIGWGHIDAGEFETAVGKYLDMCLDAADRAQYDTNDLHVSHAHAYLEGEDPEHDEFYVKVCPADHALAAAITIGSF